VDVFADGILARKISLRKAFVYHHHARRVLVVSVGKETAAQQRYLHQLQIVGLNPITQRQRQVRLMFGVDDLLNGLLRALSMRNGKRERKCSYPKVACLFLSHIICLCLQKVTIFL